MGNDTPTRAPLTADSRAGGITAGPIRPRPSNRRRIALLMGLEAASLAVMSALHLSGTLAGGEKPYTPDGAGIPEAIICVVLAYGATTLVRRSAHSRSVALLTTGFAIFGFIIGLRFTIQGGKPVDVAYHATVLPLLVLTLVALLRNE